MGIESSTEIDRSFEAELGKDPILKRKWVLTLSDSTLQGNGLNESDVFGQLGISSFGEPHPSFQTLGLRKIQITERHEGSPYHVLVVADYGLVTANEKLQPTSRSAEWTFESQPSEVAALFYYDGQGTKKPLTNSAFDYFSGLTTEESLVRAKMRKNYQDFPSNQMAATNKLNEDQYFGGAQYTWKCSGVNAAYTIERHNGTVYEYWAAEVELLYRQSTWVLQLPDIGWNYISGNQKRRAMVFDYENGEWVASANPVALSGGAINLNGQPDILQRRVHQATNFSGLFGIPPT